MERGGGGGHRGVEARPDWAESLAVIGGAQQQLGNPMPATHAYQRYLELAPKGSYADDVRSSLDQLPTTEFPTGTPLVLAATVNRKGPQNAGPRADSGSEAKWSTATVFVAMPRAIDKGDRITVIPVRSGIPSVDSTVTSSKAQPRETDLTPATWLVEADTTEGLFLSAPPDKGAADDTPFEAVVVYPAHPGARLLSRQAVRTDLPKAPGASARTLWTAIDIDGDGHADAEILQVLLRQPHQSVKQPRPLALRLGLREHVVHPSARPWTLVDRSSED